MSAGVVWLCDEPITHVDHPSAYREHYDCPATSRAARTESTLRTVASRDGWVQLADGSHRCPSHAGPPS